jgi:quercetin dioxygenase-like cupin family protein
MRLRVPDRYRIPPHYHPVTKHVTVLKGTFKVGMGEKFDASAMTALPTGTFAALE